MSKIIELNQKEITAVAGREGDGVEIFGCKFSYCPGGREEGIGDKDWGISLDINGTHMATLRSSYVIYMGLAYIAYTLRNIYLDTVSLINLAGKLRALNKKPTQCGSQKTTSIAYE